MNINMRQGNNLFLFSPAGILSQGRLKSTEDKLERQQNRDDQIAFFEQQKANLKDMKCDSLDEISRKLGMLHSYEDEITAIKAAYNDGQISHILDEARELGEKIAEEAEKMKPKTAEERQEELAEEALKADEETGAKSELEEALEEIAKEVQEIQDEAVDELLDEVTEETPEDMAAAVEKQAEHMEKAEAVEDELAKRLIEEREILREYKPIDVRV